MLRWTLATTITNSSLLQPAVGIFQRRRALFRHPDGTLTTAAASMLTTSGFSQPDVQLLPWGLSLNVVEPLLPGSYRVRFRTYAFQGAYHHRKSTASTRRNWKMRQWWKRAGRHPFPFTGRGDFRLLWKSVHHFHRLVGRFMGVRGKLAR